jgi:hypothetical protein
MNVEEMRQRLPLGFDRTFRPWSYRVTQRRLEFRSDQNFDFGETLYVVFLAAGVVIDSGISAAPAAGSMIVRRWGRR